ncbi:hypothetical protein AB0K43_22130 [Kitasatospora sp. NPDC049258]|uniref:hypothetical protein n=1 Tax=Kitasatospora sp. NPDC049258 TaxID=3155394 RepID=UPI00343C8857
MTDRHRPTATHPAGKRRPFLPGQHEGLVHPLAARDPAVTEPATGKGIAIVITAKIQELAERLAPYGSTSRSYLPWLAHQVVATRAAHQLARC